MKSIKIYITTLILLLLVGDLGNRFSSFSDKEGSFFMLFFWCAIISGVYTLLYVNNKDDDK